MARHGIIQNEEVLLEVLNNGGEFFIPCKDKNDAHSKCVSLNNVKRRLREDQQKQVTAQQTQINGVWGVKIFPSKESIIWKLVDGELVRWNPSENTLTPDVQRIISLMTKDGLSVEEILSTVPDAPKELVLNYIKQLGDRHEGN